ncbi:mitotic checkpoint serine/threonine-protein kinase BUB1 beta-like [Polymixia lowei]
MAEREACWEENTQQDQAAPTRQHGSSQAAIQQDQAAPTRQHGSSQAAIQQQRQSFESQLHTSSGEDALDVWDRYIKWTLQTYPHAGKDSNLNDLLQRSVMEFANEKKYFDDARYVDHWIKLAQNSLAPGDMYSYMQTQGVGQARAAFYVSWAQELEKHGNFQKAADVLQEGLRCKAQPLRTIQQSLIALQGRLSGRALSEEAKPDQDRTNPGQEEEEPCSPPRTNRVDLRPRGRKRAAAAEPYPGPGHSGGLNLPLPHSSLGNQNAPITVFDENQSGLSMVPEPWMALPPRASVEKQPLLHIKMSQSSGSTSSLVTPPTKPSDQTTFGSTCQIEPATTMVLSARQPLREEVGIDCVQPQEEGGASAEGRAKEQSMYCKDLLTNDITEFSFEELRAQRYFQSKSLESDAKLEQMSQVKQQLIQQIEERQRLLLLRKSGLVGQEGSGGETVRPPAAGPLQIYHDSCSDAASALPYGAPTPCPNTVSDEVFLPPGEKGLSLKIQFPRKSGAVPSSELSHSYKSFPERTDSLTEEAIVYGHHNKTLCSGPDDTNDFAGAAKMVSTPSSGPLAHRACSANTDSAGGLTEDLRALAVTRPPAITPKPGATAGKKLSPIQETSAPSSLSSLGGQSAGDLSPPEENQQDTDRMDHHLANGESLVEDPCSLDVRSRLLDQIDVSSFPNFHLERVPIPRVEEEDVLVLVYEVPLQHRVTEVLDVFEGDMAWLQVGVVWLAVSLLKLVKSLHSCSLVHGALQTHPLLCTQRNICPVESVLLVDLSWSVDLDLQPGVTSALHLPSAQPYITQGLLEPSASPYQVDLLGVADTVHTVLTQSRMSPVKGDSGWTVEAFSLDKPRSRRNTLWSKFFWMLLNPGDRSSVSVLSELVDMMSGFTA